jgi:hypothetical protein
MDGWEWIESHIGMAVLLTQWVTADDKANIAPQGVSLLPTNELSPMNSTPIQHQSTSEHFHHLYSLFNLIIIVLIMMLMRFTPMTTTSTLLRLLLDFVPRSRSDLCEYLFFELS